MFKKTIPDFSNTSFKSIAVIFYAWICQSTSLNKSLVKTCSRYDWYHWHDFGYVSTLKWRYNECDGVSNHRRLDCLLDHWFRCRLKKTSTVHVTGLCEGTPPVTDGFPSQRTTDAKNTSVIMTYEACTKYIHCCKWHVHICIVENKYVWFSKNISLKYVAQYFVERKLQWLR